MPTTVRQVATELQVTEATVRGRLRLLGLRLGDLTPENIARVAAFHERPEAKKRMPEFTRAAKAPAPDLPSRIMIPVRPGALCTCGNPLVPGGREWFCSPECRRVNIEACCATIAGLFQQGVLSR